MLRHLKTWLTLMLVMVVMRQVSAFTIWGPAEAFQTTALSYLTRFWYSPTVSTTTDPLRVPGNGVYTELGGPKNFGEGSRLNAKTITYAYDYTFLNYYGAAGVKAVDAAFAILNALPAASSASANLTEFITQGNQQINYTAQALSMLDLKSTVLQIMIEHMGLLGETHVYDLLAQQVTVGCSSDYFVGVRNYDPITFDQSTYVNGVHYDYFIEDGCTAGIDIADAMEELYGEPGLAPAFTAVATAEGLQIGGFYLGVTRDDFGGLRYLYRKGNYNNEAMPPDTYVGSLTSTYSPSLATNTLDAAWTGTVGGAEKITYVKVAYDSAVGYTFPTNVITYNMPILTNFMQQQISVTRTNTAPDIIFAAANLLGTPAAGQDQPFTRTVTFIAPPAAANNALSTVSEVISPTMLVTFNNVGPLYLNENPGFLQGSAFFLFPYFQFGSFDGSTNAPIAFPTGTSLDALAAIELTTPSGQTVNSPYNPIASTNTVVAGGTGGGTVAGAGGTTAAGGAAASARINAGNSPKP